jgi:hypothetical protein
MDIHKMLGELRTEREQVEEAIIVLERWHAARAKGAVVHLLGWQWWRDAVGRPAARTSPRQSALIHDSGGNFRLNRYSQLDLVVGRMTTERYLGTKQDLVHAPNDEIKLRLAL